MTALREWVEQILLFAILLWFAETMLPQSHVARFARVPLGLLLLLVVLSPLLQWLRQPLTWPDALVSGSGQPPAGWQDALERGRQLARENERRALEMYRARLEEHASQLAEAYPGVAEAEARAELDEDPASPAYGAVQRLYLSLRTAAASQAVEGAAGETTARRAGDTGQTGAPPGIAPVQIGPVAGEQAARSLPPPGAGLAEGVRQARQVAALLAQVRAGVAAALALQPDQVVVRLVDGAAPAPPDVPAPPDAPG